MTHGLLNTQDNKFYIVSDDYYLIKTLQLLTMKHRLFLCVNISKISDTPVTSENCYQFGISKPLTKFLTPDVDTTMYGAAVIESAGDKNAVLANNLHTLERIVEALENFTAQYESRQKSRYEEMINGLSALGSFVESIIPNDPNIKLFVEREIEAKTSIIRRAKVIKDRIFFELMSVDPWQESATEVIREKLNSMDSIDIELFTMMKNISLKKL